MPFAPSPVLEPGFPGIICLLDTKGMISPALNAMEKSKTAPPASVRGAGCVADAVLIAANLNTAFGASAVGRQQDT